MLGDERIDFESARYNLDAIAMEPKPPQGAKLPIWVGGLGPAALRRAGRLGDGWMGTATAPDDEILDAVATIRRHATEAGRDPPTSACSSCWPRRPETRPARPSTANPPGARRRAEQINEMGFEWTAINATAIFQAGARSVSAIIDQLADLHGRLRRRGGL